MNGQWASEGPPLSGQCVCIDVCVFVKNGKNEAFEQRPGGRGGFGLLYRD